MDSETAITVYRTLFDLMNWSYVCGRAAGCAQFNLYTEPTLYRGATKFMTLYLLLRDPAYSESLVGCARLHSYSFLCSAAIELLRNSPMERAWVTFPYPVPRVGEGRLLKEDYCFGVVVEQLEHQLQIFYRTYPAFLVHRSHAITDRMQPPPTHHFYLAWENETGANIVPSPAPNSDPFDLESAELLFSQICRVAHRHPPFFVSNKKETLIFSEAQIAGSMHFKRRRDPPRTSEIEATVYGALEDAIAIVEASQSIFAAGFPTSADEYLLIRQQVLGVTEAPLASFTVMRQHYFEQDHTVHINLALHDINFPPLLSGEEAVALLPQPYDYRDQPDLDCYSVFRVKEFIDNGFRSRSTRDYVKFRYLCGDPELLEGALRGGARCTQYSIDLVVQMICEAEVLWQSFSCKQKRRWFDMKRRGH